MSSLQRPTKLARFRISLLLLDTVRTVPQLFAHLGSQSFTFMILFQDKYYICIHFNFSLRVNFRHVQLVNLFTAIHLKYMSVQLMKSMCAFFNSSKLQQFIQFCSFKKSNKLTKEMKFCYNALLLSNNFQKFLSFFSLFSFSPPPVFIINDLLLNAVNVLRSFIQLFHCLAVQWLNAFETTNYFKRLKINPFYLYEIVNYLSHCAYAFVNLLQY